MSKTTTTVSAPGKVLLAGGYLVLESPNAGLVIAADARFYCTVELNYVENANEEKDADTTSIVVDSPQFHSSWKYVLTREATKGDGEENEEETGLGGITMTADSGNSSVNGFVEKTIRLTLAYVLSKNQEVAESEETSFNSSFPSNIQITIRADNDFYSVIPHLKERGWDATPENVTKLPRFLPCPLDPSTGKAVVNKTGLGSSAALVTSLVGALWKSFNSNQSSSSLDLQTIHNLAQICHCHAQGKVGSGFDVSSAVYGSHVYRRFPKCTLPDLLSSLEHQGGLSLSALTMSLLKNTAESKWSGGVVSGVILPKGLDILLADVCGGSESPSMARKVVAWKASRSGDPPEPAFWEELAALNPQVVDALEQVRSNDSDIEGCASTTAEDWKGEHPDMYQLHSTLQQTRQSLKKMGDAAGVPIEPDCQTDLADATMALPGVVTAVVPGAGGYDALACLLVDTAEVRERVGVLWKEWKSEKFEQICPLSVKAANFEDGLRVEKDV